MVRICVPRKVDGSDTLQSGFNWGIQAGISIEINGPT